MNDPKSTNKQNESAADEIGRLVRFAGERETADVERTAGAHARVSDHWNTVVAANKKQYRQDKFRQLAIAASLIVAVGITFVFLEQQSTSMNSRLFAVERVTGEVMVNGQPVVEGALIADDAKIETLSDGLIALHMPDGQSARLDNDTKVTIAGNDLIELAGGAVYIDSGLAPQNATVSIATPFGVATDVGTQFIVRVDTEQVSVGVREGSVQLSHTEDDMFEIESGQLFEVSAAGATSGRRLASDDQLWSWAVDISPPFEIEGSTLENYLVWYAREAGLELRWESTSSHTIAQRTRLSGTISGMPFHDSLSLVRRIAPFESRVSKSTLHVQVQ